MAAANGVRASGRGTWWNATVFLVAIAAAIAIGGTWAVAASPETSIPPRDRVCMVQDTVMDTPAVPVEHEGKTYYGCCDMCKGKIKADPKQYTLATDPVSGKVVDKATAELASVNGDVYYFESAAHRNRFVEDPSKYARHARASDGK